MITFKSITISLGLYFLALSAQAQTLAQYEEARVAAYIEELRNPGLQFEFGNIARAECSQTRCLTDVELRIDAIAEFYFSSPSENRAVALSALEKIIFSSQSLSDRLQAYLAIPQQDFVTEAKLEQEASANFESGGLEKKARLLIANESLNPKIWETLRLKLADRELNFSLAKTSVELARDLISMHPDASKYLSGRYAKSPRLFMFCRQEVSYPCQLIIKDHSGGLMRDSSGEIWHQPSLGFSGHGRKYNEIKGNTPRGAYRIDGVMPEANAPADFGKFRRMILNFIAESKDEKDLKSLLPESSRTENWWKESTVARDIGRGLFRIHGTGHASIEGANFYPFVPTSGCIAQRENTYHDVTYIDQRRLLDALMMASEMPPTFANEAEIRALLYVINIDDTKAPVSFQNLRDLGILP